MTQPSRTAANRDPSRLAGLSDATLAALVMLVIEYALGMWLNLHGGLPVAARGRGLAGAVAASITQGSAPLAIHALLGLLLLVSAASIVIRAIVAGAAAAVVLSSAGLLAVIVAAASGAHFIAAPAEATSLAMAVATAVALLLFGLILYLLGRRGGPGGGTRLNKP